MLINLDGKKLYWGSFVGSDLARLEFLWDAPYAQAEEASAIIKREILSKIPEDSGIDDSSYKNFTNSILKYYSKKDIEIYYAIFVGICIQRFKLVGSSSSQEHNAELFDLAKSTLNSIPASVIQNKMNFIEVINRNKNNDLSKIIDELSKQ